MKLEKVEKILIRDMVFIGTKRQRRERVAVKNAESVESREKTESARDGFDFIAAEVENLESF